MAAAKAAKAKAKPPKQGKPPAKPVKKAGKASKAGKATKGPAPSKPKAAGKTSSPRAPAQPSAPVPTPAVAPRDVAEDSPAAWIAERSVSTGAAASPTADGWIPVPSPAGPARPPQAPVFDPATGEWLPVSQVPAPAEPAPDAAKKGTPAYVLWTILLVADLVVLAGATLFAIWVGVVLVFAPDSAVADDLREDLTGGTKASLIVSNLLNLLLFGIIPLLWVLGTRRVPLEGTKRFLHMHLHRRRDGTGSLGATILWGVVLAAIMLAAVTVLITAYTCATDGCLATPEEGEEENPAIQGLLDHLDWPLVVLVALCAGVGEEIFFRGFLQRYLGVWGQAVLFGLAHATGGYLPQILFALGLGVAFGYLIKRGWSLWTLILAHFLYDFVLLGLALLYPELG